MISLRKSGILFFIFVVFSVTSLSLIHQFGLAQKPAEKKTVPVISVSDVSKYIDQNVVVEGKVFRVGYSPRSNTYFLNFTPERGGFTVIIFDKVAKKFEQAKINIRDFEGKVVQVTGIIKNPPQYGLQIVLNEPAEIRIVTKEKALKPKEVKVISVNEVDNYVGQYVAVKGKVLKASRSQRSNTYFLNFTPERGGFTVVIFDRVAQKFEQAKIDILSFENKQVKVTGTIEKHPRYGVQIILEDIEDIEVLKSAE